MTKTILKNKKDGTYGTLEYSMFGGSVHWFDGEILGKSLGESIQNILGRWDIVPLPEGYEVGEYGGVKKIEK
ncbi:hypothetical protein SAMN04487895_101516 [Paenibacillus sophorae]|uniref:Uncharacterized protein n=1 Tax=Paenibacillus sophorae TaxID=1333845 RepID=A0A1H8GJD4_9BACL|nr:hypothetical protein [Paenibacillus sophorae]QWU14225.1 hypothetical protein KP014_20150 [Paenibacillus sophorae]SEN43418.1 hypothetical protein SAMN04487895_101516 [Paenibacillus sophorae]